jgi:hypothetical protein
VSKRKKRCAFVVSIEAKHDTFGAKNAAKWLRELLKREQWIRRATVQPIREA